MAGGSFPFFSVSRYNSGGQAKFVSNVGLVPEASASSCSSLKYIRKAGMWGLTDGPGIGIRGGGGGSSSRYETSSSRYSSELDAASSGGHGGQVQRCCYDPSSSTVAGDQLVLDLAKSSTNGTLVPDAAAAAGAFKISSNCASPCISWNGQKQSHSVYMDNSCTTAIQNLLPWETVYNLNGQRACAGYGSQVQTTNAAEATSQEFKPDDASSHNNVLRTRNGDLGVAFPTRNNKDLKVEDLAGLSESINESLLQEDRVNAPQKPNLLQMQAPAKSGSKRKAAEIVKRPLAGAQVKSERNYNTLHESRIVRVSRLTGGKDRHSKVRTAKGLRDRRVRLSVPTAIQFYDLQDRLGYDQPSMAVDWLIKVAKAAIDELPVQDMDTDMASGAAVAAAEAGSNLSQLTSTNCSPVKSAHGSPKESATAAAAAVIDLTVLEDGVCFVNNERKFSKNEMNGQLGSKKDSEVGRSSSSTSDGSIVGAEYTSKSSLSKSARLKEARERRRKKLASARNPSVSSQLTQPNSLQSSLHSHLNILGHSATLPLESQYGKDGSPSGISNQVSARIGSIQPLWDYDLQSFTDITYKGSRQFQHVGALNSSSNGSLENSSSCMQPVLSSSYQSYEMADSGTTYFDPKQRNMGGNTSQINSNLIHSNQQQQQSQAMQKHFGSTFPSPFFNDVNFLTSGVCGRGPLQSNSSCIFNTPSLQSQKNGYADASTKVSMFPFHPYDAGTPEWFEFHFGREREV